MPLQALEAFASPVLPAACWDSPVFGTPVPVSRAIQPTDPRSTGRSAFTPSLPRMENSAGSQSHTRSHDRKSLPVRGLAPGRGTVRFPGSLCQSASRGHRDHSGDSAGCKRGHPHSKRLHRRAPVFQIPLSAFDAHAFLHLIRQSPPTLLWPGNPCFFTTMTSPAMAGDEGLYICRDDSFLL